MTIQTKYDALYSELSINNDYDGFWNLVRNYQLSLCRAFQNKILTTNGIPDRKPVKIFLPFSVQ